MAKIFIGEIIANKTQKTITVSVVSQYVHPLYKKIQKKNKKYKVHCEDANIKIGDTISFQETRPISKDKKYKFIKILSTKN
jgi:small subunit ribosomal protein S17